jgi:hypothetical protein
METYMPPLGLGGKVDAVRGRRRQGSRPRSRQTGSAARRVLRIEAHRQCSLWSARGNNPGELGEAKVGEGVVAR